VRLIVNDRVDLAEAVGADGVHLGQDDLPPEAARRLLGPDAVIGYSTHNVEQALAASKLPISYLAIGPIFQTTSKTDTSPVLGLDCLRAVRRAIGALPLVAIGGITHANARSVIEAGADSVAVISALMSDPARIAEATRALVYSARLNHSVKHNFLAFIIVMRENRTDSGRVNPFERPTCLG